jgi:hypothetical protein
VATHALTLGDATEQEVMVDVGLEAEAAMVNGCGGFLAVLTITILTSMPTSIEQMVIKRQNICNSADSFKFDAPDNDDNYDSTDVNPWGCHNTLRTKESPRHQSSSSPPTSSRSRSQGRIETRRQEEGLVIEPPTATPMNRRALRDYSDSGCDTSKLHTAFQY